MNITDELSAWQDIPKCNKRGGILIGNGASIAIWNKFAYQSLYELAKSNSTTPRLAGDDVELFDKMNTCIFERVLASLSTTRTVLEALKINEPKIEERYKSIQEALAEAVRGVHLAHGDFSPQMKINIREELKTYKYVYSTNYDLLIYWATVHENAEGFKDYFWDEEHLLFDVTNTEERGNETFVLYLHGGLHLYRQPGGGTLKRKANKANGGDLLSAFGTSMKCPHRDAIPLLVTEGKFEDKLNSINRSDYLRFAYSKLQTHCGPLVIFGHSLDESDAHIVNAIKKANPCQVAVSMRREEPDCLEKKKASINGKLLPIKPLFFDAATHPLGASSLRVNTD